jgi:hypothetical protein
LYLIEYYFNKSHHPVQNSTSAFLELLEYRQMLSTGELLIFKSSSGLDRIENEFEEIKIELGGKIIEKGEKKLPNYISKRK